MYHSKVSALWLTYGQTFPIYAKSPTFAWWQPHVCTSTRIEIFHPLSPTFCLNHPQSPTFCLMETKLPRQIFSQEEKRKIGHKIDHLFKCDQSNQ